MPCAKPVSKMPTYFTQKDGERRTFQSHAAASRAPSAILRVSPCINTERGDARLASKTGAEKTLGDSIKDGR